MPPFLNAFVPRADFQPGMTSDELRKQWSHPGEVFSVLLILGGDVVARALAQSTGSPIGLPSFSFGWVSYSINALVDAMGENKLMPQPDYSCLVINGKTGHVRDNKSWIIGRMVRDYELWMDEDVKHKVNQIRNDRLEKDQDERKEQKKAREAKDNGNPEPTVQPEPTLPDQAGLCISIYEPDPEGKFGKPGNGLLILQSIGIAILQLGVAAIPCGIRGDWGILLISAAGILLSSATASLTQWREEKWSGRRQENGHEQNFILTRGNGSQHAIVVLGRERFLNLEDLASAKTYVPFSRSWHTRLTIFGLAALWILLLITASGLEEDTWFLLAVGGIGIMFNVYVAGKQSDPATNGLPLRFVEVLGHHKVMEALFLVEEAYPHVGRSIRDLFFPGELRKEEYTKWEDYKKRWDDEKKARKAAAAAQPG
ncbi:hypothetical protein GGR54DRAFT_149899 [Hypoxylon sp. NC1633]|nr:hypothetical protein GGR54DRAFT_149899 [Hypoxylon sp. NC1633]